MRSLANKCHLAIALSLVLISSFAFSLQEPDSPALVMQTGHAGYIRAIDISQNSEIAVTGADDSSIRVWQLPSGIELRRIFTGTAVRAVAISPDGRTVAAASFQSLSIWTIESGIREHSWSYFDSNAYVLPGVAFSRDGHTVVVADNGHVFAWDASSGKLLRAESFRNAIQCFATLQGTDNIALCQNESVTIWNLQTFKSVLTLQPSRTTFPFSPDFLAAYRQGIKLTNGRLDDGVKLPEEPDPAMVVNVGFSKDFQFIVTNNADGSVHIWDAATGLESHVIKAEAYENIAVNPTGRTFAGGEAEKVVIRNLATGDAEEELVPPKTNQSGIVMALFSRSPGKICPLRYSPDGLQLVEALVLENRLVVWNLRTRRSISTTHASISVPYAFVSSDHQHLYSVTGDVVKSWNLGLLPIPNVTPANTVFGVAVSKDGEWIGWDTSAQFEIVNVADPQRTRYSLFKCPQDGRLVQCGQGVEVGLDEIIGFSQDDQSVIVHQTSEFDPATLFDKGITNSFYAVHPRDGSIDTLFTLPPSAPTTAAFTPERNLIAWAEKGLLPFQPNAGASFHGNIHIFDIDTRTESKSLAFATMSNEQIAEMVKQTITDNPEGYKDLLLGRIGWQQGRRDASRVVALAFSSDGKMMAAAHQFYGLGLWQLDDQRLIFQTGAHLQTDGKPEAQPTALCFSPDGRWLIAGWNDGSISKFDTSSGTRVARWTGHENTVNSISYAPNSKLLFTTSEDGTIKFWNPETNEQELAISPGLDSNDWAVIAPNGLFDGGADGWVRFLWRFQSSIFSTYPVDIYFREYFHPGLLREFFACQYGDPSACDRIGTTQPFSRKSRTQPVVNSISVVKLGSKNSVSVVVDVGYPHPKFGSPSSPRSVYDIRLLRDGQLVAQEPSRRDEQARRSARSSEAELSDWRSHHRVALDSAGRASITFRNIRLPQRSGIESAQFSAYAFNSDRVKSSAVPPVDIPLPKRSQQAEIPRTAFLVTMGVNANQSRHLNLELAVSSAESARNVFRRKLLESYSEVVEIQLYSDFAADSDQATSKTATKASLQGVLDLLAGRSVGRKVREQFDPSHRLRAATPDDAVVLYIASHGYADPQGMFYLMPYDTGENWGITEDVVNRCLTHIDHSKNCASADDLLAHSISSQDLTAWWTGVDAGSAIMVLDSCHSGAVPGREFRPAPLGDPGFGQLSFDKGMVILSASLPAQTARGSWITDGKGRTLLMDAIESASEANPSQSVIELIHDAEQQLPLLAKQLYPTLGDEFQIPMLLDFSRETREVGSKPRF